LFVLFMVRKGKEEKKGKVAKTGTAGPPFAAAPFSLAPGRGEKSGFNTSPVNIIPFNG